MLTGDLLVVGDFNVHIDVLRNRETRQFLSSVKAAGLQQHVTGPTHNMGHTLDLIMSRKESCLVSKCSVSDKALSDHFNVGCILKREKPDPQKKTTTSRNFRQLDRKSFGQDLLTTLSDLTTDDSSSAIDSYNQTIRRVLDVHCPASTRTRKQRPCVPWYDSTVHEARQKRRKLERKWRKTRAPCDRELFVKQKNHATQVIQTAKRSFYTDVFLSSNPKSLYTTLHSLLGTADKQQLHASDDDLQLSNEFADYFDDKISSMRQSLESSTSGSVSSSTGPIMSTLQDSPEDMPSLTEFSYVSDSEIRKIILRAPSKSCDLDPLPTWLLKEYVDVFVPVISQIVNTSMNSGVFPDKLKEAIVFPRLKKPSLDQKVMENYRPVSNIAFMSKVTEHVVSSRLTSYLRDCHLHEDFQSAYKAFHSTETALLRVKQDILQEIDHKKAVILVLLDLSAAFDTLDHSILLARLQSDYGIRDTALQWFTSYLTGRSLRVVTRGKFSEPHTRFDQVL
ncbi:uncharacterized protein [Diadema setosum]|uniref:uncharacterized protein n=1 Tax=Diadema setosum TaxID=31175 RepID=UPI003B3BE355